MIKLLLIGAGGFIGSVSRYLISGWAHDALPLWRFPVGTITVNVIGCMVIGFLGGLSDAKNLFGPEARLFLFVGVLGGFTTFSAFGYETMALLRDTELLRAFANIFFHITICLTAVYTGGVISRLI
ncbi:MAG: fluoride efflux transporter CrcB [Nitrospirae bacterium]|nr:fluoride efflux transporter CrcB [Nitrospirota bacterium]